MIDKQEFYHGVAILRLLEDPRCQNVKKGDGGYVVNGDSFAFLKYSTKNRSPWGFSFGLEDIQRLDATAGTHRNVVVALICGGDGICAVSWKDAADLLGNQAVGWLSARRGFRELYAVAGPKGKLKHKISFQEWPALLFEVDNPAKVIDSWKQR